MSNKTQVLIDAVNQGVMGQFTVIDVPMVETDPTALQGQPFLKDNDNE